MSPPAKNVFIDGSWYGPSYPQAGDPPGGLDSHLPGGAGDEPQSAAEQGPPQAPVGPVTLPPQAGPGSGVEAWAAYAVSHGVEVKPDAKKAEVLASLKAAGVPTAPDNGS